MEILIVALIIIVFLVWRFKPTAGVNTISTSQLKSRLNDKDTVFIDVRTPAEYKNRHISKFKNIPLGIDLSTLPNNKEIIVICQSGMRSNQACKQLKKLGYTKITNVRGGMNAY